MKPSRSIICFVAIIVLAVQVSAIIGDYERPKIKTIMDKPILSGKTVDVTPNSDKAWVSNEARANSNAFKKPKANIEITKKGLSPKPKPISVLNSDVARAAYKPTTTTFVGDITGGPSRFKLNVGKTRRTKESVAAEQLAKSKQTSAK